MNDEREVPPLPTSFNKHLQSTDARAVGEVNQGRRTLAVAALLVMLGNLTSSVLGLVRQSAVAALGPAIAAPFAAALTPLQTFLDLLANGSVGGALIPTFSDYSHDGQQRELSEIVSSLVTLLLLVSAAIIAAFFFLAPWLVNNVLTGTFTPDQKALTLRFARVIMFALLIMGPFAVLQASLYACRKFGRASIAASALHVGVIAGAVATALWGAGQRNQVSLALGVIIGAVAQVAVLAPGLRRAGIHYRPVLHLRHPAVRRILRLYAPLAPSYIVSMCFVFVDLALASRTPGDAAANVTSLKLATTVIQFPVGLVAAALSFAVLPTLSLCASSGDTDRFRSTLLMGIRLGLLLMLPAAAGLIALRSPITTVLFEHRQYTAHDAAMTAVVLQNYAYQLPFLVVDQLVMFAFYARKNTLIPVLVGFLCYGFYAIVAFPFYRSIGAPALAFANTMQNSMHGVILLILFRRAFGRLDLLGSLPALCKTVFATVLMVLAIVAMQAAIGQISWFSAHGPIRELVALVLTGAVAVVVYGASITALKVEEAALLWGAVKARIGK